MPADGRTASAPNIAGLSEDTVDAFYAAVLPVRRPGCSVSEKW